MYVGGYDLDMSYITDRILAMSFPAERMRAMYRNPLWQVKSVLEMRHKDHYKVYNLCIEEKYDASNFEDRVEVYPFDDNHVPSLEMIKSFCESVHSWLSENQKNVAVVHCMAGKGRTGLMICAYLVYTGMSAEGALQLYAEKRTTNNHGVSIPSQHRYVGYWENVLSVPKEVSEVPPAIKLPPRCSRELRQIRLYDTVNTTPVFFVVAALQEIPDQSYRPLVEISRGCCREIKLGYQRATSPRYFLSFPEGDEGKDTEEQEQEPHVVVQMDTESSMLYQKTCLDYYFNVPVQVCGDVRVIFYQKMYGSRLFYCCFNTAFIKNGLLQFSIRDLDKVGNKGRSVGGSDFCVELLFGPANPEPFIQSASVRPAKPDPSILSSV